MANPEHVAKLKEGVKAWNQWRKENPQVIPDLSKEKLREATLVAPYLRGAYLRGADLTDADLREADLGEANLEGANVAAADFSGANLGGANLSGTHLNGANFSEAVFRSTTIADADLSKAKGLETVKHLGPSSIGTDAIYKSKGKIPNSFLRNAGIPEILIEYIPSLVEAGIEFYSLFISYSTKNQDFADRLYADLQIHGVRCWFAAHDMRSGEWIQDQIDRAIQMQDRLLLILSEESIKSDWVKREIRKAYKRGVEENRRVLYPVGLCSFRLLKEWEEIDPDTGKDLALEVRRFFIPDFSNWQDHGSYKKAFDKLLKDLQEKTKTPSL